MPRLMPDSRLNGAERALQHSFMKSAVFNGLLMVLAIAATYLQVRALPDLKPSPRAVVALRYKVAHLAPVGGPLTLAGAWELGANRDEVAETYELFESIEFE